MLLSQQNAVQLPLHDALVMGMSVRPVGDGFLTASIRVKINREEPVHSLRELGVKGFDLTLIFGRCWQITTNFWGYASTPEVISTFDIIESSELKQKLRSFGVGNAAMVHFRIQGSTGSQLDFIAETLSVDEACSEMGDQ